MDDKRKLSSPDLPTKEEVAKKDKASPGKASDSKNDSQPVTVKIRTSAVLQMLQQILQNQTLRGFVIRHFQLSPRVDKSFYFLFVFLRAITVLGWDSLEGFPHFQHKMGV